MATLHVVALFSPFAFIARAPSHSTLMRGIYPSIWRSNVQLYNSPRRSFYFVGRFSSKPLASEVLTCHLEGNEFPPWTSYFVKYSSVVDDQRGKSHFNWEVKDGHNYHILRTGCFPYIKYHCTLRPQQNLFFEDIFFRIIKVMNLGIPCLAYGLSFVIYWNKHTETVVTSRGPVKIYFHYKERKGAMY